MKPCTLMMVRDFYQKPDDAKDLESSSFVMKVVHRKPQRDLVANFGPSNDRCAEIPADLARRKAWVKALTFNSSVPHKNHTYHAKRTRPGSTGGLFSSSDAFCPFCPAYQAEYFPSRGPRTSPQH